MAKLSIFSIVIICFMFTVPFIRCGEINVDLTIKTVNAEVQKIANATLQSYIANNPIAEKSQGDDMQVDWAHISHASDLTSNMTISFSSSVSGDGGAFYTCLSEAVLSFFGVVEEIRLANCTINYIVI